MKKEDKDKFNKLQQEQRDLDASYRQSLKNKKERIKTLHEMAMELSLIHISEPTRPY